MTCRVFVGGSHHGKRFSVGKHQPEYKFPSPESRPVMQYSKIPNTDIEVCFPQERYIRGRVMSQGVEHTIYYWEYLTPSEVDELIQQPEIINAIKNESNL